MSGKPAARASDPTACPIPGHGTNPIVAGSPDVLFDSLPAARQGDPTACGSALASAVIPNVLINGKPATTLGTLGNHGNVVVGGSGTVIIGTRGVERHSAPSRRWPADSTSNFASSIAMDGRSPMSLTTSKTRQGRCTRAFPTSPGIRRASTPTTRKRWKSLRASRRWKSGANHERVPVHRGNQQATWIGQ